MSAIFSHDWFWPAAVTKYIPLISELVGEHLSTVFNDFPPPQPMFYSKVFIKWFCRRKNRSHWLIQVSEVKGQ